MYRYAVFYVKAEGIRGENESEKKKWTDGLRRDGGKRKGVISIPIGMRWEKER